MQFHEASQKLFSAFMQFNKAEWHEKTIAGYRPSEIRALFSIKYGGAPEFGMKVSEISKHLQVTSPTVTQLLNNLELNGLVQRNTDPEDRRVVLVKLTDKGEGVMEQARDHFAASFNGLTQYLGEGESYKLAELLTKVFIYFNEREHKDADE